MDFKSNFHEIPDMVRWTRDHLEVDDHSVRYAWRGPHMDQAFMDQEQLDHDDWDRLKEIMDKEGLSCTLHPLPRDHDSVPFDLMSPKVPLEEQTQPPLPLSLQVRWNGAIEVNGFPYPGEPPRTHIFKTIKVSDSNQPLIDRLLEV
jgi:hypothetical protein